MFVAIQTSDRSRVTSIDPHWDDRVHVLRDLAARGELVCPGCKQTLWLRQGILRRRHFAHRALVDCPLGQDSAEVWEAKAQLYLWLRTKYQQVEMDALLPVAGPDARADLLARSKSGSTFAYFVFDRRQRDHEDLALCFHSAGRNAVRAQFIHTQRTLDLSTRGKLTLTASQRSFVQQSAYDTYAAWAGASHLTFLNTDTSELLIYRGLHCVHRPNLYEWAVLRQGGLSTALVSPKTGEIVLPEDVQARDESKAAQERARRARSEPPKIERPQLKAAPIDTPACELPEPFAAPVIEVPKPELPDMEGPFRCEDCGLETKDWSSVKPQARTCVCRSCTHKRWQQKRLSGMNSK